jgi:hypothetical protein
MRLLHKTVTTARRYFNIKRHPERAARFFITKKSTQNCQYHTHRKQDIVKCVIIKQTLINILSLNITIW